MSICVDKEENLSKSSGFMFAFYHYSQSKNNSLFEKIVSLATRSDCVHVAIAPVHEGVYNIHAREMQKAKVLNKVYTAFMGRGFEIQEADAIMNDAYEYIFLPTSTLHFQQGIHFLESLHGLKYNYLALPLTVLPSSVKTGYHHLESTTNTSPPHRVICSQIGLMLFNQCVQTHMYDIDPSYCTPGELKQVLLEHAQCMVCKPRNIVIYSSEN